MQLVIAEKPSVARNIAKVLHATNVKDGYLEGKEYLVSWCIGHLIELASADQYRDDWKAWKYETLPMIPENWKYQIKESTKGQFRVLKELLHRADITEVICATDAGREGELIFRLVYNQAECKLPFKRLWISSMEEKAILEGFQQLKDGHEYDDLYYSAVARSEADWLVGINATRLFTVLYHHRLIVGRVQTPTLAMLVEREKSIENFQKEKYYLVHLLMDGLDAVSNRIKEKSAAVQMMEDMKDETAQILSVKKEKKKVQPPKLYDLTTLQREANRLLGFTAQQTLDYTQSLYEYMDIRDLLNCDYGEFNDYNYYLADSLSPDEAVDFYSNRIKNLKNWLETDGKDQFSEKEKSYLIRAYEKMKTPLYYDYQAGWKNLFQYSPSIIMILTLVLGFLCAGIFSGEFQLKANAVFYSSYYGRNKAVWAKVKAGAIIITAIYWAVMLLYTMLVLGILGVDGANCPIQSSMSGWKSIYNITNAQEYILIVLGGYLGCLFMQSLTMLVSAKTNSSVIAVIVPFILIFLPSFLSGTSLPLLNKILGLLPDQMLQMNQVVKFFNLYEIGGKVFCAVPILIISYSILLLLIVPVIYFIYRRKEVYS